MWPVHTLPSCHFHDQERDYLVITEDRVPELVQSEAICLSFCYLEWSWPQPHTWSPISCVSPQNCSFTYSHLNSEFWATLLRLLSPDCASGSHLVTQTMKRQAR